MKIHLSGLHGFVPQPERDHRAVHAVVKKVHGCGVATDMRGDSLPFERGTCLHGNAGLLDEETLDCIAAQSTAPEAGKDRIFGLTVAFPKPGVYHFGRFRTERRATLFSAFPETAHEIAPLNSLSVFDKCPHE